MISILPAAGKGTRMADLTTGGSKELLSVGNKPVLQWAIDEALESGADRVVVVSSPYKPDMNAFLGSLGPDVETVLQFVPDGLAPAIALAGSDDPAVIILPDTLYHPKTPTTRIVRALSEGFDIVLLTETIAEESMGKYGIVESDSQGGVQRILEKPSASATISRQAVAGRYGLSARMLSFLRQTLESLEDEEAEIPLTPILNLAIRNGFETLALSTSPDERRYDCGNPAGYRRACEEIG
jgi:UTP--glucose-1-phosphate uridylyltransferase